MRLVLLGSAVRFGLRETNSLPSQKITLTSPALIFPPSLSSIFARRRSFSSNSLLSIDSDVDLSAVQVCWILILERFAKYRSPSDPARKFFLV